MFLILCSSSDISALWAYEGLRQMGLGPLFLLNTEALSTPIAWQHRVGSQGASFSLQLDGYCIKGDTLRGVLNRLNGPPQEIIHQVTPADREYALQEMNAFYLSWLKSLVCPIFNPATPQGLSGRWFHASELVMLAHQAGLVTTTYRQSSHDPAAAGFCALAPSQPGSRRVIVLEDEIFGTNIPVELRTPCRNLAHLCRTPMLGIEFCPSAVSDWTFSHATPMPDLQAGGASLLQALFRHFDQGDKQ